VRAGISPHHGPRPQRALEHPHLVWGAARASQQAQGMEPWPPLTGVAIALGPPRALLHLWRSDQQPRKVPGLQERKEGAPIAPSRCQRHGRDPTRRPPVGHALSGNRVRATAAHRLRSVTGGNRHLRRVGPHVDARRGQGDGGPLRGESRLSARMWLLAVGPGRLRQQRGHRPRQGVRERRR
jgi:hypothetical protein